MRIQHVYTSNEKERSFLLVLRIYYQNHAIAFAFTFFGQSVDRFEGHFYRVVIEGIDSYANRSKENGAYDFIKNGSLERSRGESEAKASAG